MPCGDFGHQGGVFPKFSNEGPKWTTSSGPPARIGFGSGSVPMTDAIHGRSELMTASALTWAAFALLLAVTD